MRMMVKIQVPTEDGNRVINDGSLGDMIGKALEPPKLAHSSPGSIAGGEELRWNPRLTYVMERYQMSQFCNRFVK